MNKEQVCHRIEEQCQEKEDARIDEFHMNAPTHHGDNLFTSHISHRAIVIRLHPATRINRKRETDELIRHQYLYQRLSKKS